MKVGEFMFIVISKTNNGVSVLDTEDRTIDTISFKDVSLLHSINIKLENYDDPIVSDDIEFNSFKDYFNFIVSVISNQLKAGNDINSILGSMQTELNKTFTSNDLKLLETSISDLYFDSLAEVYTNMTSVEIKTKYNELKSEGYSDDDIWLEIEAINNNRDFDDDEDESDYVDITDNDYEDEYETDDSEDDDDYIDILDDESFDEYEEYNDEYEEDDGDYIDILDDEPFEESVVSKLYACLTTEQINLLKSYYLWFSQRVFKEGKNSGRLVASTSTKKISLRSQNLRKNKEIALNRLRTSGGMWEYAGFIDMGRKGRKEDPDTICCNLGHPLRYVHIAWDVSKTDINDTFFGERYTTDFDRILNSDDCILFGIGCISDFFQVDKDCTLELQRIQAESLKDMTEIYSFYENNQIEEVNETFNILDELVEKIQFVEAKNLMLKKDYNRLIADGLIQYYQQFRNLGVVPPRSLVQTIRDYFVGWLSTDSTNLELKYKTIKAHKFSGSLRLPSRDLICDRLKFLLKEKTVKGLVSYIGSVNMFYSYFCVYFLYKSCGYYAYDTETNKDEGGSSKLVKSYYRGLMSDCNKLGNDFSFEFINKLCELGKLLSDSYEASHNFSIKQIHYDYDTKSYTLVDTDVSIRSLDSIKFSAYDENQGYSDYRFSTACDFLGNISFIYSLSREIVKLGVDNLISKIRENYNIFNTELPKFIEYINSKEQENLNSMNKSKEEKKEDNSSTSILTSPQNKITSDEEFMKALGEIDLSKYTDSSLDFPKKILGQLQKSGKMPTGNQRFYLNKLLKADRGIIYTKSDNNKVLLSDRADLQEVVNYLCNNKGKCPDTKTYDILCTVQKYGTISERQMKYVEEGVKIYNSLKEKEEL